MTIQEIRLAKKLNKRLVYCRKCGNLHDYKYPTNFIYMEECVKCSGKTKIWKKQSPKPEHLIRVLKQFVKFNTKFFKLKDNNYSDVNAQSIRWVVITANHLIKLHKECKGDK